jgi:hypothetical protein
VLRDSGETGLYLQPGRFMLVTLNRDGIKLIGCMDLSSLGKRLAVGAQLSASHTQRLKPVIETIGWDWANTQLSPLGSRPGQFELFDTAELNSATAELAWDIKQQRAAHLLIVRLPRPLDEQLRTADAAQRAETLKQQLELLGWPDAVPAQPVQPAAPEPATDALPPGGNAPAEPAAAPEPAASAAEEESVSIWQLDPSGTAGEFRLWLTPDAAIWELRTAQAAAGDSAGR